MKKVMSRLMNAGCEAYDMAPLHVEHDHPIAANVVSINNVTRTSHSPDDSGVYGCGVYKANCNALFSCKYPGFLAAPGPLSSQMFSVYVACASGLFGLLIWYE